MRIFFPIGLLSIILIFAPLQHAKAGIWVEQISGAAEAVVISRNGNLLKAEEMMRLKPGDIVKVLDGKTSVRLLLGTGAIKKISKAQSPFKIAGKSEGSSFLSNLLGEVKGMLVASSDQTEAVAMMTRGKSKQLAVLGVGAEENLVLAGARPLLVVWQGSKAPYDLSMSNPDDEKPVLRKKGLSDGRLSIDTAMIGDKGLEPGEYLIVIEGKGATPPASRELGLLLVETDELPEDAQKLLKLGLDGRVESRLLINLLHKLPEWRLYSYSLAVQHGLKRERLMLELMK